jgi:hypothetical protein
MSEAGRTEGQRPVDRDHPLRLERGDRPGQTALVDADTLADPRERGFARADGTEDLASPGGGRELRCQRPLAEHHER